MKIGILTFHDSSNYGALCQAVATRIVFSRYGDASLIDYRNPRQSKQLQPIRFGWSVGEIRKAAKDIRRYRARRRMIERFRHFQVCYGAFTQPTANTTELRAATEAFDVLVSGSDQIWNPLISMGKAGFDSPYFLEFASQSIRKITYATSLGAYRYGEGEHRDKLIRSLQRYDAVSVREADTASYLTALCNKKIPIVCTIDPTLLLSRTEWRELACPMDLPEKFVLVYVTRGRKTLAKQCIDQITTASDLSIVVLDKKNGPLLPCDQHVNTAGPAEFVHCFDRASAVVTNKFHGHCFALNFGKPLVSLIPAKAKANRIESLLERLACTDRAIRKDSDIEQITLDYDPRAIENALERERRNAIAYITTALNVTGHTERPLSATHKRVGHAQRGY